MTAYNDFDDDYLFILIKENNEAAYTELYNRYWQKLYFLAHKHLKQSQAAEEIVQEVFLVLWKKRDSLSIGKVPAYLAAMTRYAVYAFIAKRRKQLQTATPVEYTNAPLKDFAATIDNKLLLEMVTRLSAELPAQCRLVFIKNKLQDQALDKVAADLHITPKTAETHLTKALKIIRGRIGDLLFFLFF